MKVDLPNPYDFGGTWSETPHGSVMVRKDFFCVRCARIERFLLSKEEVDAISAPHDQESFALERKAIGTGWVITTAVLPDQPIEYVVCPQCVAADLGALARFMALVDAGRHKVIKPL